MDVIDAGHGAASTSRRTEETRPLRIPTFEDKVLQRAVAMLLEAVYEQDFLDCSFGFRPGRSAQQALSVLQTAAVNSAGGWAIEVDIRKFFDSVDHAVLREVLRRRVRDGVILRLIGKWLNAGVLEDGAVKRLNSVTPQGGGNRRCWRTSCSTRCSTRGSRTR
ncbi:MAG: group II intron reverse transcriptase domain-containing protein [Polyangiaceae bacterium]|nr:group II intron reverse transcriptase domain-containing protein [Polyangiaceae bacterium]